MKNETKYKLVKPTSRKHWVIRIWDEELQLWKQRTTGVGRLRDAQRMVGEVIALYFEIKALKLKEENTEYGQDFTLWSDFRAKYDKEKATRLENPGVWKSAANLLEELIDPQTTIDVNASTLSSYEAKMRERGLRESTIGSYLKHIRAALGWAETLEIIQKAPKVSIPKASRNGKHMKGRPLTTEEFERMLEKTKGVIYPEKHPETNKDSGRHREFQRAQWLIWLTGLRLDEALRLSWDETHEIHIDNISGRRPMLVFPADSHKQREDAIVPLTPGAVEWLRKTPPGERFDSVIRLQGSRKPIRTADRAGRIFSAIGEAARVVVEERSKQDQHGRWIPKYASAQDLRRSFGARMSLRVMPAVLKDLMRHKSIETTMKYYVGQNAERTANEVWDALGKNNGRAQGDTLGDIQAEPVRSNDW